MEREREREREERDTGSTGREGARERGIEERDRMSETKSFVISMFNWHGAYEIEICHTWRESQSKLGMKSKEIQ